MPAPARKDDWSLTEKEKQTLRLIVRGHDAKSTARSLNLSVHTINERLREARRKMAVSSSREAARLLLEAEGDTNAIHPQSRGDTVFGGAADAGSVDHDAASSPGAGRPRRPLPLTGAIVMIALLALLALGTQPSATAPPPPVTDAAPAVANPAVVDAARQWLALVDQGEWDESYRGTGSAFRKLNTAQLWADVSRKVRTPLGAVTSRTLLSEEELPAPPHGYQVVKFRTAFVNKPDAMETVTLDREDGRWVIVGIYIT